MAEVTAEAEQALPGWRGQVVVLAAAEASLAELVALVEGPVESQPERSAQRVE